jgi:hypothetical protein
MFSCHANSYHGNEIAPIALELSRIDKALRMNGNEGVSMISAKYARYRPFTIQPDVF